MHFLFVFSYDGSPLGLSPRFSTKSLRSSLVSVHLISEWLRFTRGEAGRPSLRHKYGLALTFFAAFFLPQHDGEQEALQKGSCSDDEGRGRQEGGSRFSQYDGAGPKRSQDPCVPVEFLCSRRGVFSPSAFKAVAARDRYLQVSLRACTSFHVYLNFLFAY